MNFKNIITDRTRIFMTALWCWTWLLFQISRICNAVLYFALRTIPDKMIFYKFSDYKEKKINGKEITIVQARDELGNVITNKLDLFMNLKWDKNMCDDKGGVDLDLFGKNLGSSILWVVYMLEFDKNSEVQTVLNYLDEHPDAIFDIISIKNLFRVIVIDLKNKLTIKLKNEFQKINEDVSENDIIRYSDAFNLTKICKTLISDENSKIEEDPEEYNIYDKILDGENSDEYMYEFFDEESILFGEVDFE